MSMPKQLKFGMPALVQFSSIEENIVLCKKLNLDFIELSSYLPYCLPQYLSPKVLAAGKGIFFTVHLPENIEIGEIHEPLRLMNVGFIKKLIRAYNTKAGITLFNMHLDRGLKYTMPDKAVYIFEKYETEYLASVSKSLAELSAFAVALGVEINFENAGMAPYVLKAFAEIPKHINLGFTLDTGHMAHSGIDLIPLFSKKLRHMHLHDYAKGQDHQQFGTGNLDIPSFLDLAPRSDATVLIEVKRDTELEKSIEWLKYKFEKP